MDVGRAVGMAFPKTLSDVSSRYILAVEVGYHIDVPVNAVTGLMDCTASNMRKRGGRKADG